MKYTTLFLFLFITKAYASHPLHGIWQGLGEADSPKYTFKCEDIEIRIHIEESTLTFRGGHYNCQGLSAEYPYSVFEIEDQRLFQNEAHVGYLSQHEMKLFAPEHGYSLTLSLKDKSLSFSEKWQDGSDYLVINGQLEK